ncbi:hypothetical protein ABPG75_007163 [Micractinium tetrahymenae]
MLPPLQTNSACPETCRAVNKYMGEACAAQWWSSAVSRFSAWQAANDTGLSFPPWADQYLRAYFSIGVCDVPTAEYYGKMPFEDLVGNMVDLEPYVRAYLSLCLPGAPSLLDAPPPG